VDSDLIGSLIELDNKADPSSARPHFLRCRFNSSSFSFVSRISRAINDSEEQPFVAEIGEFANESTVGRTICSIV
jgi:hypothetical protein